MCVRDMRWRRFLKTNLKENLYVTVLCDFNLTTYFLVSPVSLSNLMIIKVILFQKLFCHRCSAHLSNPLTGVDRCFGGGMMRGGGVGFGFICSFDERIAA